MTLRRHHTALLALLLSLGACSWLVSPEQGKIKCKVEKGSEDPCPKGTSCIDEVCKTSKTPSKEICDDDLDNDGDDIVDEQDDKVDELCNQEDDDCDGEVDEDFKDRAEKCNGVDDDCDGEVDEGYDVDGDGSTVCGDSTYKAGTYDCEPMIKDVHPGAKEICDGLDNDCDGNQDNAPTGAGARPLCDDSQLCFEGRCVAASCSNGGVTCKSNVEKCVDGKCQPMNCGTPCGPGQFCDLSMTPFACKDVPSQKKIGQSCAANADCESQLCIDAAALNLSMSGRVCGKTCCTDAECGSPDLICFAAATGARSCLPKTSASYTTVGGGKPCASISECGATQICAAVEATQMPGGKKVTTTACRTPASMTERAVAEACQMPLNCGSRLCQQLVISSVCTTPCRVSGDCGKLAEYMTLAPVHATCQYVDLADYSPYPSASYGTMCVAVSNFDAVPAPQTAQRECASNNDCPDGVCYGASTALRRPGRCAPTCCNDAQCTQLRAAAHCIPIARGKDRYEMRCVDSTIQ